MNWICHEITFIPPQNTLIHDIEALATSKTDSKMATSKSEPFFKMDFLVGTRNLFTPDFMIFMGKTIVYFFCADSDCWIACKKWLYYKLRVSMDLIVWRPSCFYVLRYPVRQIEREKYAAFFIL